MFETDVFISYSHKDDEPLPGEQVGWVSDLHRMLDVRVTQLLGEKPKIWRDPEQAGNCDFKEGFLDQLRKTATLVPILSPSYLKSQYCPLELEAFFKACQQSGGLRVGNNARVFKVLKTRIPETEEIPSTLRDFLGYEFFVVDDTTAKIREYRVDFGKDAKERFYQKADDLAQDINQLLRQLRGLVSTPRGFVYLAETSSDLREEWEVMRRDLKRNGYAVLPDPELRPNATALEVEAIVREQLARCQLSIHMIGSNYDRVPEGTTLSLPELQNDLAAELSRKSALTRLVWLAPGQASTEKLQGEFIDHLKTAPELQGKMDLLENSTLGDLKNAVRRSLAALSSPKAQPSKNPQPAAAMPHVYLICDPRDQDQETVRKLRTLLFEGGCEVVLPLFSGEEAEMRQEHEENLRTCDGVLLYWGVGSEAWRRNKQKEVLFKSAGLGRVKEAPLTLLYVAPLASQEKEALLTHEVIVLRHPAAGPEAADLAEFLRQLHGRVSKKTDEPS